ncbi:hypothetical protein CYLTODRAFT_391655 [Cylindrobasidium torrendii FP15055 ss-10]|uniref:Uncharacterized protein n=1 Tax=Cylindrobasidium torrendii FP15055 ss-10 TaxID=1314674 RepID=A0A0D7BM95_9AGAR|nr:hypothetical protein CYLTODRAFT_391655 [Cylindrobasidium torrendii FP15055 ss-10]
MRFFIAFTSLISIVLALPNPAARAEIDPNTCTALAKNVGNYHYQNFGGCNAMIRDCVSTFKAEGNATHNPWGSNSCVAAATCWGAGSLRDYLQCQDSTFDPSSAPTLDYTNVYAPIVGDCAWQEGGCPITFQNYVDFIYRTTSDLGSSGYPSSTETLRNYYWSYVINWTTSGETVPYTNFNDFLFYSRT